MQSLQLALIRMADDLEKILKKAPDARRHMYEQMGSATLRKVQARIGGTGKVQSWQGAFVGSKSGYAAVRPLPKTFDKGYAVGYITNAIENGWQRGKSGLGGRVPGKKMYGQTQAEAEHIAVQTAEEFIAWMKKELE